MRRSEGQDKNLKKHLKKILGEPHGWRKYIHFFIILG